ncbi:alpha/beta fold hydrolase [Streptomyces sp. NPDC055815]
MRTFGIPRPRFLTTLATTLVATAAFALTGASSAAADDPLPVPYLFTTGAAAGNLAPNSSPPGANDWSCKPSAAHPRPVVLVHGTAANARMNWDSLSPLLRNNGYCVFALNYGASDLVITKALWPIESSAVQLRDFVDQVLAATGSSEVDIVGHSQGGLMPRYYVKNLGGAAKVHTLVGIAPTNHGGSISGFITLQEFLGTLDMYADLTAVGCPGCAQQYTGSQFLTDLNTGGDTVPGVNYTVIATRYDELASPYTTAFLSGPNTTNITLQDGCPIDFSGHIEIAFGHRALAMVLNALDPAHPRSVPCYPVSFNG